MNRRHRLQFLLIFFGLIGSQYQPQAQDIPPSNAVSTPIQSESIIIPMNESLQSKFQEQQLLNYDFTGFNVSSYGLVYALLDFGVPVQWVVRAGKGKDEVDFNADAQVIFPTEEAESNYDFVTSAFIVKAADMASFDNCVGETTVSPVLEIIEEFGNEVTVMRLKEDIVVDVLYELRYPPTIAVIDDGPNTYVHRDVLVQAGIPFKEISSDEFFSGYSCFSFISQPHLETSTSQYVQTVDDFVNNGGNFFAQCKAIETFEDPGSFQTSSGVNGFFATWNSSTNFTYNYFENDQAPLQFEGVLPLGIHGSTQNYVLSPGSTFLTNSYVGITNQDDELIFSSADLNGATPGGNVFYLSGHEFEGIDIPNWFGPVSPELAADLPLNQEYKRIYLNAAFMPSFVTFACAGQDVCVCRGEEVTLGCSDLDADGSYEWYPAEGLSCTECPFPVATPDETTTYFMSDIDGCTQSTVTVFIDDTNSASAQISGGGSTGCEPGDTELDLFVDFSESGEWTYTVEFNGNGLGTYSISGDSDDIQVSQVGIYSISSAILEGVDCPNALTLGQAFVSSETDDFNYALGPNVTICEGEIYTVGAPNLSNPAYTFLWHDGSTLPYYDITTAGTYSVEVTYGECFDDGSVTVSTFPEMIPPDLPSEFVACADYGVEVNATTVNASSYLWSTGSTEPIEQVFEAGSYSVAISDTCTTIELAFDLVVEEVDEIQPLFVPTAFSPNGDGINDVFRPITWAGPEGNNLEFYVYNRWGELIFESNSLENGWSGRVEGEVGEMGVYVWLYKIRGPSCQGEIEIANQGNVTLIH